MGAARVRQPALNLAIYDKTRTERLAEARRALDSHAELGGETVISIGIFGPAREEHTGNAEVNVYIDVLGQLGEHVAPAGITLSIECLNRYGTHLTNTLAQGTRIAKRVGLHTVKIMADFFHMNLEEADIVASPGDADNYGAHVHLADSNRFVPGCGHLDCRPGLMCLHESSDDGVLARECCLAQHWRLLGYQEGDPLTELRSAAASSAITRKCGWERMG